VRLAPTVFNLHGKLSKYKAKFDALISAHYTAAIIIQDHVLTLDQFLPERYDDPAIRQAAAELIDIQPDESLKEVQSVVEFELKDGTRISKRCEFPRGSYENPMTRAQIETKLRTYAKGRLSPAAIDRIISSVAALENLGSVRDLMQLLRQDVRAAAA
jgi:2-methylcitrate dehydratase PrpD